MARPTHAYAARGGLQGWQRIAALAACTVLAACAQASKPSLPQLMSETEAPPPTADEGRRELVKATEYWGKEYAKEPRNLEAALSYAKNLKAMGEKKRALAVLQQASVFHGNSRELAGEYGRLALEFDQISVAGRLLAAADDPTNPDWRIISARGTVLAKQGKYKDAIPLFESALSLAPDHPSVLSNLALAHAMNGEPKRAEAMLRQAATTDRNSLKIRQNLALVLGLQGKYAEAKLLASHDLSPENAAENTDYLRRVVKLEQKTPPSPNTTRAEPKNPPESLTIEADDDTETDAEPEPAQTSRQEAVSSVRTGGLLRGTMLPADTQTKPQATQTPQEAPDFETTFSVAQWMPMPDPTAVESTANDAAESAK
jgi:Flp pilus assembly protein TadD